MKTCIYYNLSTNKNPDHIENHNRIIKSVDYLRENLSNNVVIYHSEGIYNYLIGNKTNFSKEDIAEKFNSMYSKEYLDKIKLLCQSLPDDEIYEGDTYFSNVTYNEIIDNSIILYNVCHQINIKMIKYAYCLIRPPSHHSNLNKFSGFCIINQTYLTAKYLHDNYKKKILILDYDLHHGNGTQDLVNDNINDEIYFVSIHCYEDGFYPGTGSDEENNDKVLNVPMKKGCNDKDYISAFYNKITPYIEKNNPEIIIISNGVDAHQDDPFAVMKVTNEFYKFVTKYLKTLDKQLIYILEGGYNPDVISKVSEDIINILEDDLNYNEDCNKMIKLVIEENSEIFNLDKNC
jgi:acetoin utilization deacetylase AcuC-like enzyme